MGHKLKNETSDPFNSITQDVKTRMIALLSSISFMKVKNMDKSFVSSNLPTKSNVERFWYFSHGHRTLIKYKIKFSSYIRKFRGIGCKLMYD
jgi:hypothetical protein